MKEKIKTTSFWLEVTGVLVIVFESISRLFGFQIGSKVVEGLMLAISSFLVLIGIITKKNIGEKEIAKEDLLDEFTSLGQDTEDDL